MMRAFFAQFDAPAKVIMEMGALLIDLLALLIVISAIISAFTVYLQVVLRRETPHLSPLRKRLGHSLVLGLEFLIGADILRTAISPTWNTIGQLAAIIVLRTLLDFLLERELHELGRKKDDGGR